MKWLSLIGLTVLASASLFARTTDYPDLPSAQTISIFVQKIRDLDKYWMSADNAPGDYAARVTARNAAVQAEFKAFKAARVAVYQPHRMHVRPKKTATSVAGKTKFENGHVRGPDGYIIVTGSNQVFGEGVQEVNLDGMPHQISFQVRKTGKGKHSGGVAADLMLSEEGIAKLIEEDLKLIRAALIESHLPTDETVGN
jgi:hypothetical protein